MDPVAIVSIVCLVAGVVISGLVSLFKKWSVVKNHPKIVAMGLSIITTIVSGLTIGGMDWASLTTCLLVPFSAAVATHEIVNEVQTTVEL